MAGSERLGDCDVLFELASGGMASILLARQLGDAGFERLVALKRVHRHLVQDPEVFAMASDEARLAALVRHANVVAVTGVLDAGGELVLVQEYVEGFGLGRVLRELARRREKLSPAIAARILIDAAKGLHATHEARDLLGQPLEIVHRDVSPQNLLIGTDGTTRLIDFGIARAERRMAATRTGILKGKLSYMAPEQIGEAPVDRRADVFAAGAVLFEALTGGRAFDGNDDASVMAKILTAPPDTASVAEVCPALEPVVRRALAKAPGERFKSASELARAIAAATPVAGEEEVSAIVERLFGPELERLRDRIAAAIARIPATGDDVEEGTHEPETPLALEDEPPRPAPTRSPLGRAALAGLGGAAALAAVLVMTRSPAPEPPRPAASVPSALAAGRTTPTAPTESASSPAEPAASSDEAAPPVRAEQVRSAQAPSATASPRSTSSTRRPLPSASTAPSSRPDLHPSPYGSAK